MYTCEAGFLPCRVWIWGAFVLQELRHGMRLVCDNQSDRPEQHLRSLEWYCWGLWHLGMCQFIMPLISTRLQAILVPSFSGQFVGFTTWPWSWRQCDLLKCYELLSQQHSVISQDMWMLNKTHAFCEHMWCWGSVTGSFIATFTGPSWRC